ncbi:MAG: acyl carrier protein [Oscillospiraceae bacterium]|nr:acyl carrier protein [Oscillospiraceae bacterium]
MTKYDLKPIVKTYYDALEEGTILGRKCQRCGHVEFPPFLCCNTCGCLDTEWVDLTNMRGIVKQALPTRGAFGDPEFRQAQGDYFAVEVQVPNIDPFNTSLLHVDYDKYAEFDKAIDEKEMVVKPLIIQDEDVKVVVWEIEGESEFKKIPDLKPVEKKTDPATAQNVTTVVDTGALDEIAETVIDCAAEAYGVDKAGLTLSTDIREDLSNESMKMIVMISEIEERLKVTIEIQEASNLNTLGEFAATVRERLGLPAVSEAAAASTTTTAQGAAPMKSSAVIDDPIAETVIECAAEAYGVDKAGLTLSTDIREDLSNESMKMIVMISEIEERLKVTIEIQEASNLNTLGEFTAKVKERL